jgi:hypothetical protein
MGREFHVRFREGLGVQLPRATRLVICCRGTAAKALTVMRAMMARLRLTVNDAKTRLCRGPDEPFDFLGYTLGRCYSRTTGWAYIGVRPSATKLQGLNRKLSEQTGRRWTWLDEGEMVGRLNQLLRGWANYFCLGTVTAAYRRVTAHACHRLRQWLMKKHPRQGSKWARYSDRYLHGTLGLLRLQRRPYQPSCATP